MQCSSYKAKTFHIFPKVPMLTTTFLTRKCMNAFSGEIIMRVFIQNPKPWNNALYELNKQTQKMRFA